MMRLLVMRGLISMMILWRMMMIGHVRIIGWFCMMSCMMYSCSWLMRSNSMMNRGCMMVSIIGSIIGSIIRFLPMGSIICIISFSIIISSAIGASGAA